VRRRDRQGPFLLAVEIRREAADIVHFRHDDPGAVDHLFAGGRDAAQALALAREQLHPELLLEELELLADPRLRRVQLFRCLRDIQPVVDDRQQIFQLL
jgi:hypothetical protein